MTGRHGSRPGGLGGRGRSPRSRPKALSCHRAVKTLHLLVVLTGGRLGAYKSVSKPCPGEGGSVDDAIQEFESSRLTCAVESGGAAHPRPSADASKTERLGPWHREPLRRIVPNGSSRQPHQTHEGAEWPGRSAQASDWLCDRRVDLVDVLPRVCRRTRVVDYPGARIVDCKRVPELRVLYFSYLLYGRGRVRHATGEPG